jgi:hypothetical protein
MKISAPVMIDPGCSIKRGVMRDECKVAVVAHGLKGWLLVVGTLKVLCG